MNTSTPSRVPSRVTDRRKLAKRRGRTRTLRVENLENRQLMAASWGLSGGVLNITADPQGSRVVIQDTNPLNMSHVPPILYLTTISDDGTQVFALPKSAVQHVNFIGSSGSDEFVLNAGYRFTGTYYPQAGSITVPITARADWPV